MLRPWCCIAATAVWSGVLVSAAWADEPQGPPIAPACYLSGADVVCDVRTDGAKNVRDITATVNDKTVASKFTAFDKSASVTAWYFLIQETAHPRDSVRMIEQIAKDEGRRNFGIGSFSARLNNIYDIGATQGEIKRIKDKDKVQYRKYASTPTRLFSAALEGLDKLKAYKAERKALVLFADGRNSSAAQSEREELVARARELNIPIFSVFMNNDELPATEPSVMRHLATDTSGVYFEAKPCSDKDKDKNVCEFELDDEKVSNFLRYLEKGGTVRIASSLVPKDANLVLNAEFTNSTTAKSERVKLLDKGPGPDPTPPTPYGSLQPVADWVSNNTAAAIGIGAVALSALLFGAVSMRRSPQPDTWQPQQGGYGGGGYGAGGGAGETEMAPGTYRHVANGAANAGDTVIYAPGLEANAHQAYAWLQFMDAEARRVPISSTNVRIGRSKDNDIVLQNRTVHRQHVVIKRSPEGMFSIHHLGGDNIPVVNGRQSSQAQLNNNDTIELGEVRMRFCGTA